MSKIRDGLIGIVMLATVACEKPTTPAHNISSHYSFPVVSYQTQKEDIVSRTFGYEKFGFGGASDIKQKEASYYPSFPTLVLEGDGKDVDYYFNLGDIMKKLNPDLEISPVKDKNGKIVDYTLPPNKTILVPDFNKDDFIRNQRGIQKGYVVLKGTRTPKGELVEKTIEYKSLK